MVILSSMVHVNRNHHRLLKEYLLLGISDACRLLLAIPAQGTFIRDPHT